MDNASKNFANKIVSELEKITHALELLLNAPGKHHEKTVASQDSATKKHDPTQRQSQVASEVDPAPPTSTNSQQKWYQTIEGWKPRVEIIGILFAIGYGVVTYLQWRDSSRNFTMDQRAWVVDSDVIPSARTEAGAPIWVAIGKKVVIGIVFGNSGQSPAIDVHARMTAKLFPRNTPFTPLYDAVSTEPSTVVLAPDGKGQVDLDPSDPLARELTKEEVMDLADGDLVLRAYGEILYRDIFGDSHETTFCIDLGKDLQTFKRCNTYNKAN